jgi:hypothetical protein
MKILLLLSLVLLVLTFTRPAPACVCDTLDTPKKAFGESVAVFTGKYIGAEYRSGIKNEMVEMQFEYDGKRQDYQVLVQRFEVTDWFKGGTDAETVLVTDQARMADGSESIADCGLGFEVGRSYLIYAYGDTKEYGTGACTRTRRLSRAHADLVVLKRLTRK